MQITMLTRLQLCYTLKAVKFDTKFAEPCKKHMVGYIYVTPNMFPYGTRHVMASPIFIFIRC